MKEYNVKGLGDVLEELTAKTGIKYVVEEVAKAAHSAGIKETPDCGCSKRKEVLNNAVPFNKQ